jgi:hypothetical protein
MLLMLWLLTGQVSILSVNSNQINMQEPVPLPQTQQDLFDIDQRMVKHAMGVLRELILLLLLPLQPPLAVFSLFILLYSLIGICHN